MTSSAMRLAISNIAWDVDEDEAMATLLRERGIDAIDIAPGKYFPQPANARDADIRTVTAWWADRGIEITGMQALLFGTSGLNVFGDAASQQALLDHLRAVCHIGGVLGAPRLVFGSPRNRDRHGLDDDRTLAIAREFFGKAGDAAADEGVLLCLEPNPTHYGANFMTTSAETEQVVRAIDHPAIRMQIDSGAITINGESAAEVAASAADVVGHIHASEPDLVPLGDGGTDHAAVAVALAANPVPMLVSIEMVATKNEPHLDAIARAIEVADVAYRSAN